MIYLNMCCRCVQTCTISYIHKTLLRKAVPNYHSYLHTLIHTYTHTHIRVICATDLHWHDPFTCMTWSLHPFCLPCPIFTSFQIFPSASIFRYQRIDKDTSNDVISRLERLGGLLDRGLITKDEFSVLKSDLLTKI